MLKRTIGRSRIWLRRIAFLGLLFVLLPALADHLAAQDGSEGLLERIQLTVDDLPLGFEVDSQFLPEVTEDARVEATSGVIFLRALREGASVVLSVNLYLFPATGEASSFYEQMMQGDQGSVELSVGERARGKSKEQPSPYREGLPASAILFQRDRVVAFLITGQLDGNVADGVYLSLDQILDLDGLAEIGRIQDQKIIEAVGP